MYGGFDIIEPADNSILQTLTVPVQNIIIENVSCYSFLQSQTCVRLPFQMKSQMKPKAKRSDIKPSRRRKKLPTIKPNSSPQTQTVSGSSLPQTVPDSSHSQPDSSHTSPLRGISHSPSSPVPDSLHNPLVPESSYFTSPSVHPVSESSLTAMEINDSENGDSLDQVTEGEVAPFQNELQATVDEKKQEHSYTKYERKQIFCNICDKLINGPSAFYHFKLIHNFTKPAKENVKNYVCDICGLVFTKVKTICYHMSLHHIL